MSTNKPSIDSMELLEKSLKISSFSHSNIIVAIVYSMNTCNEACSNVQQTRSFPPDNFRLSSKVRRQEHPSEGV